LRPPKQEELIGSASTFFLAHAVSRAIPEPQLSSKAALGGAAQPPLCDLRLDLPELLRRNETDEQCDVNARLVFRVLEILGHVNVVSPDFCP
jgi:hypothetical protein